MSKTTRFNPDDIKAPFRTIDLDKLDQRLRLAIEMRLTNKFAKTLAKFAEENTKLVKVDTTEDLKAA